MKGAVGDMNKHYSDGHRRIRQITAVIALALILVGICMPASVIAGDRKIKGEWILPKHYPEGFDGYGHINRIATEEVVIDDALMRLSPSVNYATPENVVALMGDFAEGDLVGYVTNSQKQVVSLWLIKKAGR
jgi:hypothetical protein